MTKATLTMYMRPLAKPWFCCLWVVLALAGCVPTPAPAAPKYSQVVAFGDSLSDYGNVAIPTDTPTSKPSTQIIGTWVMQLAEKLNLKLEIASKGGTNYARCWATSADVVKQVDSYLAAHPQADAEALYVIWAGGNDIFGSSDAATAAKAVDTLRAQFVRLRDAGARNLLWVNLPPMGKIPVASMLGDPAALESAAKEFNTRWLEAGNGLARDSPEVKLTTLDVYAKTNDIIANKTAYNLDDVSTVAIGKPDVNPDKFLFWDGVHPTTRGHQIIAEYAYDRLSK